MLMGGAGLVMICVGLSRGLAGRFPEQVSSLAVAFLGMTIQMLSRPAAHQGGRGLLWGVLLCVAGLLILVAWSISNVSTGDHLAGTSAEPEEIDRGLNQQQALQYEEAMAQEGAARLADRASFQ
ncbi:hypothetical protein Spb1_38650 [Planctopirus ephydatiae]|uniref:Uncharacterized protein n=1 Tax=Planctopirus ephydatiae TaxID=2528019 RepID=A0A518GTK0_9PLAN|nr:hypothetical protein [Planctopirus ephydatiae]QDV31918.1 hypothetical protein Spb1_38650 [Planctopirus ephydatiae]